jgi:hypothetical protein
MKYKFNDTEESHLQYWDQLVEASLKHPMLKPLVLRLVHTKVLDFPLSKLARILQYRPDHNDIASIASIVIDEYSKSEEKPFAVLQALTLLSVTDEIFARSSCRSIAAIIKSLEYQIPWLRAFLKKATGFVIVAQQKHLHPERVSLVFELFGALFETQIGWLQSEISNQAAILLGSQKVPIAIVNGLKPAVRYESSELHQWEGEHVRLMDLAAILLSVIEDPGPRLPCAVLKCVGPARKVAAIGCLSLPNLPTINSVISQRNKGKRAPAKPVVKSTRFPHLSVRH